MPVPFGGPLQYHVPVRRKQKAGRARSGTGFTVPQRAGGLIQALREHEGIGVSATKMKIAIGMAMFLCAALGGLAGANVTVAPLDDGPPQVPDYRCSTGGMSKTLGTTQWLVYSCDDAQTLVFVSDPESLASPYYFTVFPHGTEYHVFGEGTGDRQATEAAFKEIELFTTADIRALLDETRAPQPH